MYTSHTEALSLSPVMTKSSRTNAPETVALAGFVSWTVDASELYVERLLFVHAKHW